MTALALSNIIGFVAIVLNVLIIVRIAVSWIGLSPWHPLVHWLRIIVDPILAPFRRMLPSFSGIDFSPILAIVVIYFVAGILQAVVQGLGGGIDFAANIVGLIGQVVIDIIIAIAVFVFIRILLALFHADPWHPLVQMVRTVTTPLVGPFAALHRGRVTSGIDVPAVAALIVYIALVIVARILFGYLTSAV